MNWKNKIWKYLTAFVVAIIILNPEMVQLAFFIDALGLEIFFMLVEIQFLALLGIIFNTKIKPIFSYVTNLYSHAFLTFSWRCFKDESKGLMLTITSPAILMHILVLLAAFELILNVYL